MTKIERPFQLVVHWDKDGQVRATANRKTYYFDDDGTLIGEKICDSCTLEEAGKDFPLGKMMTEAQQAALVEVGKRPVEIEALKAQLALREQLLLQALGSCANLQQGLAQELVKLGILQKEG